ncbi:MAG TPA: polyprenyl synthetase family protein [Beutenbergiaceae bacterium]|nr:polyprenyl synthetase family protein [Beutenbergiaceae bacterium]
MPDPQKTPPAHVTLEAIRSAVVEQIDAGVSQTRSRFDRLGEEIEDQFDVATRLVAGGKRLRAAFAVAGWTAHGGAEMASPIVLAGSGLELFQAAALVHDDVIDDSLTRRGAPAAHRQFAAMHAERSMAGAGEEFGRAGAILLGDLLLVMAQRQLLEASMQLPSEPAQRSRQIVTDMMTEVTLGQYLDIYAQSAPWHADPTVDVDRAHRVLRSKSARYSVEHPLLLGAAMAGATETELHRCSRVGLLVGEAFQLRDDLLGIFGDPEHTGKPTGDDIREGKRTILMTTAMTLAPAAEAAELRAMLGRPVQDAEVDRARTILSRCGAVEAIEAMIAERTEAAYAQIDAADWPPLAADLLRLVAQVATTRTR